VAVLFALIAPADSTPGRPLYPTSDHQGGLLFALVAIICAFAAGAAL
jgi:hypothetical protein